MRIHKFCSSTTRNESQDAYTNNISLVIELVVKSRGFKPALHPDLVAASNASHGAVGGFPVRACEGSEIMEMNDKLTGRRRFRRRCHSQQRTSTLGARPCGVD